jgi:hypothetical protein
MVILLIEALSHQVKSYLLCLLWWIVFAMKSRNIMYDSKEKLCQNISFEMFQTAFNWPPICTVLGCKVLVLHEGLFSDDAGTIEDLEKILRDCQTPESASCVLE